MPEILHIACGVVAIQQAGLKERPPIHLDAQLLVLEQTQAPPQRRKHERQERHQHVSEVVDELRGWLVQLQSKLIAQQRSVGALVHLGSGLVEQVVEDQFQNGRIRGVEVDRGRRLHVEGDIHHQRRLIIRLGAKANAAAAIDGDFLKLEVEVEMRGVFQRGGALEIRLELRAVHVLVKLKIVVGNGAFFILLESKRKK